MDEYLEHHGIKGQRWGVRNYQDMMGRLTTAGRERYGVGDGRGVEHLKKTLGRYKSAAGTVKGIAGNKARFAKSSLKMLGQDARDYGRLRAYEAKVMYARPAMRAAGNKMRDYKKALFDINGGVFDADKDSRLSTNLRSMAKKVGNEFASKSRTTSYYKKKSSAQVQRAAKAFVDRRASQLKWDYHLKKFNAQRDDIERTMRMMDKLIDSSTRVSDLMSWKER